MSGAHLLRLRGTTLRAVAAASPHGGSGSGSGGGGGNSGNSGGNGGNGGGGVTITVERPLCSAGAVPSERPMPPEALDAGGAGGAVRLRLLHPLRLRLLNLCALAAPPAESLSQASCYPPPLLALAPRPSRPRCAPPRVIMTPLSLCRHFATRARACLAPARRGTRHSVRPPRAEGGARSARVASGARCVWVDRCHSSRAVD